MITALVFSGFMTMAWLPSAAVIEYEAPAVNLIDASQTVYVEAGGEATLGPLFIGGSVRVNAWPDKLQIGFWPWELDSFIDAGLRAGPVEIGWRHECSHPVTPYAAQWITDKLVPTWDSGYDELYLTLRTGGKP